MARSSLSTGRTRVGGSGFTYFQWHDTIIGFCRQIAHTSPTPVGPGPTPIHPLDSAYPIEIITPAAQNIGTVTLELYELYNHKVWDQLSLIANSVDLVNIFIAVASHDPITLRKYVRPPSLGGTGGLNPGQPGTLGNGYVEIYNNAVITNVEDGETIEVGTMELTKRITVAYTKITYGGDLAKRLPNYADQMHSG